MIITSITNFKGGVGKTTTVINMAAELAKKGYRVLVIDNDMQANTSRFYKAYSSDKPSEISKLLVHGECQPIKITDNIDLIDSNLSLLGAINAVQQNTNTAQHTKYEWIKSLNYDYVLIDNPPSLSINVINALMISDEVIVPLEIDEYSLEGYDLLSEQINDMKRYNTNLKLRGVLITRFANDESSNAGVRWLLNNHINIMHIIRNSKKVKEATFAKQDLYTYSSRSAAAQDYKNFVNKYLKGEC